MKDGFPLSLSEIRGHELFMPPPPKNLFHYTNLAGAAGIIKSHSLWLTKIKYLNDTRELQHCLDMTRQVATRYINENRSVSGIEVLDKFAGQMASFTKTNICVASFCEDGDLLSMWRGYGSSGQGVALNFMGSTLVDLAERNGLSLMKCIYDYDQQQQILYGLCDYIMRGYARLGTADFLGYINTLFLRLAPTLKDRAFLQEQEWRLVSRLIKTTESFFTARETPRGLIPYAQFNFQHNGDGIFNFLTSVVIGPSDQAQGNAEGLLLLMNRHNVTCTELQYSSVPYRNY